MRSIKEECLDRLILLGEQHLRRALAEFVAHYDSERNHQGLENELIEPLGHEHVVGPVRRRQRLGGMLNYYYRAAYRLDAAEFSDSTGQRTADWNRSSLPRPPIIARLAGCEWIGRR